MALTIAISLPDIGTRRSFVQTFSDIELFSSCFFFCAPCLEPIRGLQGSL